jgi:glutamine synthetase
MPVLAEYIWMDGATPTQKLRSKTKVLDAEKVKSLKDLPEWGFDGSSTGQAPGDKSDCALKPVSFFNDPIRGAPHVLVMCEVMLATGEPHPTNTRAKLRAIADKAAKSEPWFGIEQEYTLFEGAKPLGWPDNGFPAPQFGYYCGVGSDEVFGRDLVEAHTKACIDAGLKISGTNAEVMPAQWEFQIGPIGPLEAADQVWIARWLLYRIGEDFGISATLYPKPVKGDWNGAGAHTNFSTKEMRQPGGMKYIEQACLALEKAHAKHIAEYGAHNEERLTGRHETAHITEFRWGVSDRGASIRIPLATSKAGYGYLEDRRPAASMDPYRVCRLLLETVVLGVPGDKNVDDGTHGVVLGNLPKRAAPKAGGH